MALISKLPEVCVLIPYFNNLLGLLKSLKSISFEPENLCVLIVDDGSSEPLILSDLVEIKLKYQVQILRLPKNSGITKALNAGLAWLQQNQPVKYIARLDCGDICDTNRFYKQVTYLNTHPKVTLLGSWCIFKKPDSSFSFTYTTPTEHNDIVKELHFRNAFIHPTIMFRYEILQQIGYYPENYEHVEDYAFFMKIAAHSKTAILNKFLVTCEINPQGISIANRRKQLKGRYSVVSDFGKNPFYRKLGLIKLDLLKHIPYNWILKVKQLSSKSES